MNLFICQNIWLKPRLVIAKATENTHQLLIMLPFILLGFIFGLDGLTKFRAEFNESLNFWSLLITIPLFSGVVLLLFGWLQTVLLKFSGKIWNGGATTKQLANICSLANFPFVGVLFYQLMLMVLGHEPALDNVNGGLIFLILIWSFSLQIIGISMVQKFNYAFSCLNFILSNTPWLLICLLRA